MAIPYPDIKPVAVQLGPIAIRWYGLAYIVGLVLGWRYTVWLSRQKRFNAADSRPNATDLDDFLFWAMAGVLIGGRLGIVFFYKPHEYLADPLSILRVWEGGMSFHGGMLGVLAAMVLFARRRRIPLLQLSDLISCAAPIGLFFGRLANFVNGELWGRVVNPPDSVPWAMVFPTGGPDPRHPSQLYEAATEGLILFVLLAILAQRPAVRRRSGLLTGLFLIGYSAARTFCELFREPDSYLGFIIGRISMGQILSAPMLIGGIVLVAYALRRPERPAAA
ncbi:MAG TPA: prolipoprotein diacylglyceryl transferase [Alphaproteobacteria bacterium]|jgi:phosphatidylglycerol:prolipoprotein diacylglycerol transferase|nr:prolipoprotein diacylglyceryl transferase [Alphaproteobacteria bacterium]